MSHFVRLLLCGAQNLTLTTQDILVKSAEVFQYPVKKMSQLNIASMQINVSFCQTTIVWGTNLYHHLKWELASFLL